jgi:hypothetical protein
LCVSKNVPLVRVGFPAKIVTALWPDIEPEAASKTCSGTPLASSTTSMTLSLWTPASASGCSALDVRAEMKASLAAAINSTRSVFVSKSTFSASGSSLIQRFNSANSASYNWAVVGAVTTTLFGNLNNTNQSMDQLSDVDLPVPWPDLTEILRSPRPTALKRSS